MKEKCMKKRIIKAVGIATGITTTMGIINYILGTIFGKIIGIKFLGGEMSSTYGFGIKLFKTYPLYSLDNPIESTVKIHIAPVNFLLTLMMLSIVIYFICLFMEKRKN